MDTQKFKLTITRENRTNSIIKVGTLDELVDYTHFILRCVKGNDKCRFTTPDQLHTALNDAHRCPGIHFYIEPAE